MTSTDQLYQWCFSVNLFLLRLMCHVCFITVAWMPFQSEEIPHNMTDHRVTRSIMSPYDQSHYVDFPSTVFHIYCYIFLEVWGYFRLYIFHFSKTLLMKTLFFPITWKENYQVKFSNGSASTIIIFLLYIPRNF